MPGNFFKNRLFYISFLIIFEFKNIEVLSLTPCNKKRDYSLRVCQAILAIPMFERLQDVNISYTEAGDDCLSILGAYCEELRY